MDNTHTNATPRDRWRRYGAFAVSLAERARYGASYNPLCERTIQDPYPAVHAAAQRKPGTPKRHSGELGDQSVRRCARGRKR